MIGKRVPDVTFRTRVRDESVGGPNPYCWQAMTTDDYFKNRRVVVFSLPGAFTPTCSTYQLPGFEKGHADLVNAIHIVSRQGKKVSLVLIGDGPERSKLIQQINALGLQGMVHLPGYIREPQRLLEEIDLMVLPSHTEGLPNAALEALLMEVPVLATRVGGTPEVITDGETGRLVPAHSPEDLAAGVLEFLANPESWKLMASRGKDMVKTNFNFQARTRKLEAIYVEMMKELA